MSELHHLLTFPTRPITEEQYIPTLKHYLQSGIPATYTLEQVAAYETSQQRKTSEANVQGEQEEDDDDESTSNTTPLHILARSLPKDLTNDETVIIKQIMDILFEYGAGWNFLDYENKSIGDLLLENPSVSMNKDSNILYQRVIEAGISAELLLRKVNGGEIEFIDSDSESNEKQDPTESSTRISESKELDGDQKVVHTANDADDATAADQNTYLQTQLEYTGDGVALVTKENRDGVMMDWETNIMEIASKTIFPDINKTSDAIVLNIGFGMGIIDTFIQEKNPKKHYISEAHPDVLAKMKKDGWYEKPNVVILEGRWQDTLNQLLDEGKVFFDGIYYDTFSEHYQDMLDLYDIIVGLIKPEGVFSFFNGLGADRPICYDVYKRIVELDMAMYGMKCEYSLLKIDQELPDWKDVKRSYFNCNYYYHPRICFI
ncbi:protein-arginine N5-methyltransferase NDAI_0H01030 [Naumovozyma dairenensis CBS 421]|uniref:Arginine N-methyltransferase 2 n=1 Tax=Naumovozyma dairenensis (strain ATCC 10597 / BCRC 20456 / CBS 421 / NBRC 0211 / NRRL Y-12639) TaxID=1071378 RepID=G0WER6_NAUDC|nr:hypothetical protein NDAI_0H01030 [Naumovozyma dairenensis CBS 421]CCD26277.1 hypothetical protein NDAI_0H01030 [Naumovozyma dairenensis CBS 421]